MNNLLKLIIKDFKIELRNGAIFIPLLFSSLLLVVLFSFGIKSAQLHLQDAKRVAGAFFWILVIISSLFAISRLFTYEEESDVWNRLFLSSFGSGHLFASKVIFGALLLFPVTIFTNILLNILNGFPIPPITTHYILLISSTLFGITSLLTLVLGITFRSSSSSILLLILSIPLIFPLFFAASELTLELSLNNTLELSSQWFSIILGVDILYFLVGINLFDHVYRG